MSISQVTSEALQQRLRELLPSQQGFGTDLSASDTIIPIIDLTDVAGGTLAPSYLTSALSFASMTAFTGNATVANTAGFWRIFGVATVTTQSAGPFIYARFEMTDGATTKVVWGPLMYTGTGSTGTCGIEFDFIVFLNAGESISSVVSGPSTNLVGSTRQIADVNGTIVNPAGFSPS